MKQSSIFFYFVQKFNFYIQKYNILNIAHIVIAIYCVISSAIKYTPAFFQHIVQKVLFDFSIYNM